MRYSRVDLDEARSLYQSGLSFADVGRVLGFSATWLARRFKAAGIPVRPSGRPFTSPGPLIDVGELVCLRDAGTSYRRLGERYGMSKDGVRTRHLRAKRWPSGPRRG